MTEPTEPTPPPDRRLPEDARARIRAELLAHAHDHRSSGPRWAVPAAAAAAVALVAGLGVWAVSAGRDEPGGPPVTSGGSSSAPATPSATPSVRPSSEGTSTSSAASSVPASEAGGSTQVGTDTCAVELKYVLRGAEEAFRDGDVSFWVKGERFSLCYELDGSTTVTQPLPVTPREEVASYRVASLYPPTGSGHRAVRVAGGVVPEGLEGVFDVAYTFPDGHTEHATTDTDSTGRSWWRMVYSYDDGGNELQEPEIEVTVSYSGVQQSYRLQWGPPDTCAQANHGC